MIILVINSGSSSLKYQVRDTNSNAKIPVLAEGIVERIGTDGSNYTHEDHITGKETEKTVDIPDHAVAFDLIYQEIQKSLGDTNIDAVGHRVVHGGEIFKAPTKITPKVTEQIEELSPLAPLHNPANALGIKAITQKFPEMPQVAVFDTAFHTTLPEKAWRYALPNELYEKYGIRRYGFHGTSHDFVSKKAAEFLGLDSADFDGVIAHIGNGASLSAIKNGESIDTSMGFTPLAGLVMGTRTGDIDPSILVFLGRKGYSPDDIDDILNKQSGYKGLNGESDMRSIVEKMESGDEQAKLALEIGTYNLAKYIAGYHIAVGGMKALVFTAGVGENSSPFREQAVDNLAPLGIKLDKEANNVRSKEIRNIATEDSSIPVLVIPTNEELYIAQATEATLEQ
ncbi:MAG: acetate kinase [Micrococcaceae bacterium]